MRRLRAQISKLQPQSRGDKNVLGSLLAQPLERIALAAKVVRVDEVAVARVAARRAVLHGVGVCQEVGCLGIL
jgi:hypothetical protein